MRLATLNLPNRAPRPRHDDNATIRVPNSVGFRDLPTMKSTFSGPGRSGDGQFARGRPSQFVAASVRAPVNQNSLAQGSEPLRPVEGMSWHR